MAGHRNPNKNPIILSRVGDRTGYDFCSPGSPTVRLRAFVFSMFPFCDISLDQQDRRMLISSSGSRRHFGFFILSAISCPRTRWMILYQRKYFTKGTLPAVDDFNCRMCS